MEYVGETPRITEPSEQGPQQREELSADHLRRDHDGATVVRRDQPVRQLRCAYFTKDVVLSPAQDLRVSWEILAKRLNHSTPSITRRYIGVQMEEVEEILLHTI